MLLCYFLHIIYFLIKCEGRILIYYLTTEAIWQIKQHLLQIAEYIGPVYYSESIMHIIVYIAHHIIE